MSPDLELDGDLLRRIIDVLPRAIVVTDAVGTIRLWSAAAERLYGWDEASVLGRPIFEILQSGESSERGEEILEVLLAGGQHQRERAVLHRDGSTVRVFSTTRALIGPDGQLELVVGATDDLAELAALERQTQALTDHLRLALDAGGFGTWQWDLATGTTTWDAEMERVFGLEPGTFDGTFEAWKALIHPEDLEDVLRVLDAAVTEKTNYRLEHRVVTPAGEVRWVEGAGRVTLDDRGAVTGTIGCSHDITERAEVEQERERLTAFAVDALARERVQRERLELVAAVNEALEDAEDLSALMARVTRAVVPRLGDWCSLHVLESEHDRVPLVEASHRDPDMVRYAQELRERYPFDPDAPTGIAAVIRTGRPEFHPLIDEELIVSSGATDEQRQILRDLGLRSALAVPLAKGGRSLGAMQFVMAEGHRPYSHEDLTLAQAIAARIAATLDNRRLRQQRERTARTDAELAGLGRRLASAASVDQVLAVIAEGAPRVLGADRAEVGLALDAENLTLTGAGGRTIPLDGAGPIPAALAQTETILHEGGAVRAGAEPREEADGSLVASPLYDDVHEPMGVLILSWDEPTKLDEVDLNAIETLSRLCGQSIVRSQLAGHTVELAELAASMAAARTTMEVARLLRDHGRSNLRATIATLRLIEPDTEALRAVLPSGVSEEIARRYELIPLDATLPLADAVRDQHPVWIADPDDYSRRYPDAAVEAVSAGVGAAAVLPLCDSDGDAVGAMAFAWPVAMRFDHRLRSRLATLSDLAAQTLERVRLFEAEHAVVVSMQRRLLAPLPTVDRLEMAAFYEPAAAAVGMGGDWYEAVPLGDGTVVVIIGDVVGHGVDAVAAMAQIQHLLTGLLRAGTPLGDVLARANAMITGPEHTFATALLLHLDPVGRRVGYTSAGHPWALLRRPDRTVEYLDANQHPMFGLDLDPGELVYRPLPEGSLVLAYTDGLVERRGERIDDGIERVATIFGRFDHEDLEQGLLDMVDEVRAADPEQRATTDDVAAVLIRAAEPGGAPQGPDLGP